MIGRAAQVTYWNLQFQTFCSLSLMARSPTSPATLKDGRAPRELDVYSEATDECWPLTISMPGRPGVVGDDLNSDMEAFAYWLATPDSPEHDDAGEADMNQRAWIKSSSA